MAIERLLGHLPEHWETLSIAQIEQLAAERPATSAGHIPTVETEMLIRPIAMTTIVAGHVVGEMATIGGYAHYWAGGALALLMTAGYNICRFQKPTLLSDHRLDVPANYARRILLPFYLLVAYKCLQWAMGGPYVAWSTFLLLDDYVRYADASSFLIYWFIGALFQCIIILTALFYVPRMRDFARRKGYWFGLGLLILAYAAKTAVHVALLPEGALHFPNNQLDAWAYAFALGWMVSEARTDREKVACVVLGVVGSSLDWGLVDLHTAMLTGAMLLVLYLPRLRMPVFAQAPIALWARATFFIYLTHGFAMAAMRNNGLRSLVGPSEHLNVAVTVALSTVLGVGFYLAWRQGERLLSAVFGRQRKGRRPETATETHAVI